MKGIGKGMKTFILVLIITGVCLILAGEIYDVRLKEGDVRHKAGTQIVLAGFGLSGVGNVILGFFILKSNRLSGKKSASR